MKYFAAFLKMQDPARSQELRPQHIQFLDETDKAGKIFARGRFTDGSGGLVVYQAETMEEAARIAGSDPYIASGARVLDIHEWDMKTGAGSQNRQLA
jgi:uncharacterized protein